MSRLHNIFYFISILRLPNYSYYPVASARFVHMFFASELGSKPVRPFLHQNGDERDIYKELFGCQGLVMVGTVLFSFFLMNIT